MSMLQMNKKPERMCVYGEITAAKVW